MMSRDRFSDLACYVMAIVFATHSSVDAQSLIQQFNFTEGSPTGIAMSSGDLLVGAGGTTVYTVTTAGETEGSHPVESNADGLSLMGSNLLVTTSDGAGAYSLPNLLPTSGGITVPSFPDPTGVAFDQSRNLFYLSLENTVRVYNSFGSVVGSCLAPTPFDNLTGLTTTDTTGQMFAVGSNGLYRMQTSATGCSISAPTSFTSFTDPQAITHVPGSNHVWVAFNNGPIAEFSVGFGSSLGGVAGRTTLDMQPDQHLVMDWSTPELDGIIAASDLTDLKFTWLRDGATRFQDDAIVNSIVQPIGGVPRGLEDIRFNFDLDTFMLIDGPSSDPAWDNDFNALQSGNALGETVHLEGAFSPSETASFTLFFDGVADTNAIFTTFTQSTVIVPEPSTLVCGLIISLASWAAAGRASRATPRNRQSS